MTTRLAIVVRTQNHASSIGETLRRLHEQDGFAEIVSEVLHLDVGSKDGTVGLLRQFQPEKLIQLEPARFGLGASVNWAMRATDTDWVVFLAGDAWPEEHWLENLAAFLPLNTGVAAVACRQKPRPGCRDVYARDQHVRFGSDRPNSLLAGHHTLTATAISREVWSREQFRTDLPACEMEEWGARVESLGWNVLMAPEAQVLHSREDTLGQAYSRAHDEAIAWSIVRADTHTARRDETWRGRNLSSLARTCWLDAKYSFEQGSVLEWPYSVAVRIAQYVGEHRALATWHQNRGVATELGRTQPI